MVIDFITYTLKKRLAEEVVRAESAETALKIDSFADVNYDASGKTIDFYNGYGDLIGSVDATDFIIDGMIESVYLSGTDLCIIFNTDAGQQDIIIDLTSFINPANYYTKDETDTLIGAEEARALSAETLIEERVDEIEEVTAIALNDLNNRIPDVSNYVTSAQVETQITNKGYATSGDVNTALANKYAPSTAGEAGQVVMSNGSGMPSWSSFKFWYGTQTQYDAITTKDSSTIYFVKPD